MQEKNCDKKIATEYRTSERISVILDVVYSRIFVTKA